jgi:hypothetical protein
MPMPAQVTRVVPVALDEWQIGGTVGPPMTPEEDRAYCARENILLPDRPLVPASEDVAKLPQSARAAFAARCAARVAPLRAGVATPEGAAALIHAAATDETPVPADVFGPLWPKHLTPEWAKDVGNANGPATVTQSE